MLTLNRLMRIALVALLLAVGVVAPVTLTGCAAIGVQQPKTFSENVAFALAENTALREAATLSLQAGQLSVEDAEYVLALTDRSRALIDAARLAYTGGDLSTAEGRLQLVIGVLTQVQTYLNAKGIK